MTIKGEWEEYVRMVYRKGITPEQEKQLRNTFYAGVEVGLLLISYADSKKTKAEASAVFEGFEKELEKHVAIIKKDAAAARMRREK
jgi:hypothetical protein